MIILAIETSCDDTGCAVVQDGREVLSNVVASQVPEHILYGGVVPEIASRRHCESVSAVCRKALADAHCTPEDIDAIAVTYAPGLIGALLVGVNFAKGLAFSTGKPLIPVHHLRGHIAANYITHPALEPPFLALVVSGGHTHLVNVKGYTNYQVIGRTRDDAAGEAMDKAARILGYPYPGGLNLDKNCASANRHAYRFPKPRVDESAFDFSFSGMKTSVINLVHTKEQKGETLDKTDIGASFMQAVADVLCEKTAAAIKRTHSNKLAVAGGVSANSVLREELTKLCKSSKTALYLPELTYCGDNAAMIGAQAYFEYKSGHVADIKLNASAALDIDK